jgi:Flp pilus assembly protein TadG
MKRHRPGPSIPSPPRGDGGGPSPPQSYDWAHPNSSPPRRIRPWGGSAPFSLGQSLVEFALILPFLLVLILGIIEFGTLIASYTMVQSASREAARFAATVGDTGPGTLNRFEDCAGIRDAALRLSGSLLAISTIVIEYDTGPGSPTILPAGCPPPASQVTLGTRVVVRVRATHRPIVPLIPIGPIELVSETRSWPMSRSVPE